MPVTEQVTVLKGQAESVIYDMPVTAAVTVLKAKAQSVFSE